MPYIRYHHERPDGRGYPERLKGADIPLGAMIIAVADAFDAITTERPYQKARTFEEGLAILKGGGGTKWDSDCVAAVERILPKIPVSEAHKAAQGRLMCLWDHDQPDIVLGPGPPGGAKMRWLKPGVDFARYKRVILENVLFFFAPDSEYKGMDPQEVKGLADAFKQQLVDSLKKAYPIVAAPGPDVARIRFAITDLRQNRPFHSDVRTDGPIDIGNVSVRRPAATSWSGSGATEAEVLIFDSLTQDVIAAAKDNRTTGLKEKFTKWGGLRKMPFNSGRTASGCSWIKLTALQ